jgi:hypothetical protein
MERRKRKEPIDRLKENLDFLQEMIENPEKLGAFMLIRSVNKPESRPPIDINLFDFKRRINKEIKRINKKIYKKLGLDEVPDGIKR